VIGGDGERSVSLENPLWSGATRVAIFMPAGVASGAIAQNYLLEQLSQRETGPSPVSPPIAAQQAPPVGAGLIPAGTMSRGDNSGEDHSGLKSQIVPSVTDFLAREPGMAQHPQATLSSRAKRGTCFLREACLSNCRKHAGWPRFPPVSAGWPRFPPVPAVRAEPRFRRIQLPAH